MRALLVALALFVDGNTIHMLVGTEQNERPVIAYQCSTDGGKVWTKPTMIGSDMPVPYRAESDDFHVVATKGVLVAVWSAAGDGPMNSGVLVAARSTDGGKTWRRSASPSSDPSPHGRRFTDLAVDGQGVIHAVWLDRKDDAQLRYARSADQGLSWSAEKTLDDKTCECCWNRIQTDTAGNIYVLYRDADPRDMALLASLDGGNTWLKRPSLGGFHWTFSGCPHVGGGLALTRHENKTSIHTLVWTGKDESAGLYYLRSSDNGASWTEPRPLGGSPAKHSALAASRDGALAAVWDAYHDKENQVWGSLSTDNGVTWSKPSRLSAPGTMATHPTVVALPSGFQVFWTERRGKGSLRWKDAVLK